jgi:predicted PurR-regulated permease PerM
MARVELPKIPSRQLVAWTLGITAVIGIFWLLIRFRDVGLLLLTAVLLSTAVRPAAAWLEKRGIPKSVGILLLFGLTGLLLALLVWYAVPVLAEQGSAMSGSLAQGYTLLRENLGRFPNILVRRLLFIMPAELPALGSGTLPVNDANLTFADAMVQSRRFFNGLFAVAAIGILTFYWTLEGERVKQAAILLVPVQKRGSVRELVDEIEGKLSRYLLGQGLLCLIIGGMAFIAYMLIGLPHALLLAIFAGLLEAVPVVGPVLGAVPAIIVGLSISPATALWVVLATVIIQQLENNLLVPRVMSKTIGVRPLVTLLALVAFGSLFGLLGALIALPVAAVIQLLVERTLLSGESLAQPQEERTQFSRLRYEVNQLVQDVRSQVRDKKSEPSADADALEDEVEAIALDLESFLAEQGQK